MNRLTPGAWDHQEERLGVAASFISHRHTRFFAITCIAVVAWCLRAWPLIAWGATGPKIDYDEGVYFSTAALFWKSVLPYKDFVLVHPPGLLIFLSPIASLTDVIGTRNALSIARWAMTLVGFLNALLLGRTVERAAGPFSGIVASLLYAISPEAVAADRSVFLEPVVNLCAVGMMNATLRDRPRFSLAGVYAAAAVAVKLLAGVWAIGLLTVLICTRRWIAAKRFTVAASVSFALLVGPFALLAPRSFFDTVIHFQVMRPPDGFGRLARLAVVWNVNRVVAWLPAAIALALGFFVRRLRESDAFRIFGAVYVLAIILLLLARTYWKAYNVQTTISECALGGMAAGAALTWLQSSLASRRTTVVSVTASATFIVAGFFLALYPIAKDGWHHDSDLPALAANLADLPHDKCLFGVEPGPGLFAGRLPPARDEVPIIVETYATTLIDAMTYARFPSTASAQISDAAVARLRPRMEACASVVLGDSFVAPLGFPNKRSWFRTEFVRARTVKGRPGFDRWDRQVAAR